MSALAPALQAYFTDRLIGQRAASPNTIGAYKATFRLLLAYAAKHTRKAPGTLDMQPYTHRVVTYQRWVIQGAHKASSW
jgi:hypothetical protein